MDSIIRGVGKVVVWILFGIFMFLGGWWIRASKARKAKKQTQETKNETVIV